MSIAKQPHNISVRFSDEDYKQLLFLQDKFARMSYGKVSLADVLRIATKELYNIESSDLNRPITREKSYTPKNSDSENKDQEMKSEELQITKQIEEENLSTKIEKENQLLQEAQEEKQEQENNS